MNEDKKDISVSEVVYIFVIVLTLLILGFMILKNVKAQEVVDYDVILMDFEKDSPNEYMIWELYQYPSSSNSVVPIRSVHEVIRRISNSK